MANRCPSRSDGRQHTEIGEGAPSLRRTASRSCGAASPSRGIARYRIGNPDEAAHVGRLDWQPPLSEGWSEAASPRAGSSPGPRSPEDLPAGRSPSGQRSESGHRRLSQPTAAPTASEFLQPVTDPTGRTDPIAIPPYVDTPFLSHARIAADPFGLGRTARLTRLFRCDASRVIGSLPPP